MNRRGFLAVASVALVALWGWSIHAPRMQPALTVTFLDVGQGDSIVVETPGGHTLVVDSGRITLNDDAGRTVVLPFLRSHGLNRIDALLLTHPDDDHVGGARTILERISVGRLLVSGFPSPSPIYLRVLEAARRRGVPIVNLARGQSLDFRDSVTADVLNPPSGGPIRSNHPDNDGSIVLRVRRGTTSVLLTGDAEEPAELDMVRSLGDLHADVLKLGHHGSRTSSSELFLDRVHPHAAIVSAGLRNIFGHPNPLVLQRLAARRIPIFRTDQQGSITVTSDGRTLHIRTMRQPVH